jgi:hypothetical protein
MLILVFTISTVFFLVKLHRCQEVDEEKSGDIDAVSDEEDSTTGKEEEEDEEEDDNDDSTRFVISYELKG